MVETQRQYENFDDLQVINPEWDSNSFEFGTTLLETGKDRGVERKPDTKEGKKVFDYKDKNGGKWEIVIGKTEDNKYEIRVKKRILLPNGEMGWRTQKNGDENTFSIIAKNKTEFNKGLGGVLDATIGAKNRIKLVNTGNKVFEDLNKVTNTGQEEPQEAPQEAPQQQQNVELNETKNMPQGLTLDHGTYIYEVQKNDCESIIKRKLERYEPLSYLKGVANGINGYNFNSIPDKKLLPGLKITIPKPDSERIKTVSDFKNKQKLALNTMKNNANYGSDIKELIKQYGEDHIIRVMTAYARTETSPYDYDGNVGSLALFRYERTRQCPSYGYYHILYEKVGKKVFKNTGLTIGQSCNPLEAGELFLAFCIEKANGAQKQENRDFKKFFNMEDTERCAKFYNGVDIVDYSDRLKHNFNSIN